jgi:glycosyltransferase involved in cell wall biosynthesis
MTAWLYCICRNEARLMPYLLRHYTTFVDKLIFYDDQSDDGTRQLIQSCPQAELRDWPGSHGIVDDEFMDFANQQWKEARGKAHWVIWIDADEFIYHPQIVEVLDRLLAAGVDLPQLHGYTMVADHFPTTTGQIYDEIKTGFYDEAWSKPAIFRADMKWNVGRHSYDHVAVKLRLSDQVELKLLHYRCLGMDYLRQRHERNWDRVPDRCRRLAYGTNCAPDQTGHHTVTWFDQISKSKFPEII